MLRPAFRLVAFVLGALLLAPTSSIAAPSATTLPQVPAESLPTLPSPAPPAEITPTCGAFCESAGIAPRTVSGNYHLDAWGNYRNPQELEASKNRFGFTGHLFDRETGTYYARARYFDPRLGRFLSQDSYLGEIDNPPSIHRYAWAHNRPTYFVDPTGHGVISMIGRAARIAVRGGEIMDIFADAQADYEALKQADGFADQMGFGLSLASNLLPVSAHDVVDLMDLGRAALSGDLRGATQVALGSTRAGRAVNAAVASKDVVEKAAAGDLLGAARSAGQATVNVVAAAAGRSKGRSGSTSNKHRVVEERRSEARATASAKPGYGDPDAASWRYDRYVDRKTAGGAEPRQVLDFEAWKAHHFDPAAAGGRPGRRGGPEQVAAKRVLEEEGLVVVENVRLGSNYPDAIRPGPNAAGGTDYFEVGKMLKRGAPESRERRKLASETKALGPHDTVTFVSRQDPEHRITYRSGDRID